MDDEHETVSSDGLHPIGGVGQTMCKKKKISYKKMVTEAVENLKERRGSSRQSILKFIVSKYALGRGSTTRINSMITKMFKSKQLIRTRGSLEDGAFKLNSGHMTPFASAGRSKRRGARSGRGKRRGKKSRKRRGRRRGKRSKKKSKKGKKKGKKGRRGKKRKGGKGKKKKRGRTQPSFFPRI